MECTKIVRNFRVSDMAQVRAVLPKSTNKSTRLSLVYDDVQWRVHHSRKRNRISVQRRHGSGVASLVIGFDAVGNAFVIDERAEAEAFKMITVVYEKRGDFSLARLVNCKGVTLTSFCVSPGGSNGSSTNDELEAKIGGYLAENRLQRA